MSVEEKKQKLDLKLTFFIGLAFFTTGVSWSLYNSQVNQALFDYLAVWSLVGVLMALDNLIGVFIQPFMGSVSDSTRTRLGRRMPYIIIGTISAAIFFALIPTGFGTNIWILIIWMFFFGISMGFYRSQAVALMPDFVRPHNRSKANAIINLMGGVGSIIAFTLSLVSDYIGLQVVFIIVSIIMVIALGILLWKVREENAYSYKLVLEAEQGGKGTVADIQPRIKKPGIFQSLKEIVTEKEKSTLFMLLAIFAWFIAYQGAEALFSVYAGPEGLQIVGTRGTAGFLFNFVAIPFIIFALPGGIIAGKIGRRLTIKIGLVVILGAMIFGFISQTNLTFLLIALVIFGLGWACVNVNSIVIVWELAPSAEKIGTYTGAYYFFSVLAAILGPYIIGALLDLFGTFTMFLMCGIFFLLAFILMFFVKRGEVELTEEEKIAKQKAMEKV
ncbi:MAG: MFS transporter [Candidatus Lokiarchaeota archaeon]|nr:MFS transporter [Candidatus Lokiarchaeota archaeon]MBD3199708.1 MFS transporter [Candidatus Lokiarchaeota archaeon]